MSTILRRMTPQVRPGAYQDFSYGGFSIGVDFLRHTEGSQMYRSFQMKNLLYSISLLNSFALTGFGRLNPVDAVFAIFGSFGRK